jgi:hypothetical protein
MTQFGRFLLGASILAVLAVSARWTILPLTPGMPDFFVVSLALGALWALLAIIALLRLGKRGLWMLAGAPLVFWWPMALILFLLSGACETASDCI